MSISKEVRIGILVTFALAILFIGFYFLKGANIFSTDKEYYCYFSDVDGLQNSSVVQIRGLNVGHVSRLELEDDKGVKVVISINKHIDIPQGTVADLASADLLGSKMIRLDMGKGTGLIAAGATLPTTKQAGIIDNVTNELTPRLQELKITIATFDSTLSNVNMILGAQNQQAIASAVNSMKVTADNLSKLTGALDGESGEISGIIHNTNNITANFARENDTVRQILANVSHMSGQLANAPIQKTITDLEATTSQLQGIVNKINNNEGSLGMLVNNKDAYNNLTSSLHALNDLLTDLKAHPGRYVSVSVFGKKHD